MLCGSGHLLSCSALWCSSLVGIADTPNAEGKPTEVFGRPKSF